MQKHLKDWQLIYLSLRNEIPVILLYVLYSKGSSPGRQGFMMAVNLKGNLSGSLGGGIMEFKFVELAKEKLKEENVASSLHLQIHNKAALQHQSGMICSGEQTIFLHKVKKEEIINIENIIASLKAKKNGTLKLTESGISFISEAPITNYYFKKLDDNRFVFREKTGYKQYLFIVGAGHCSLAFSHLMSTMDFHITLFDVRENLNTLSQNKFVHKKIILTSYTELEKKVSPGEDNYIVIMTNGYRTDDIAVKALFNKKFSYLGLLGSKSKIDKMFADFKAAGIAGETLNNIKAPIGIAIKSQTPEEIAVSIAAEIIKIKNGKNAE
jgi:xanthine dehydrogenase accessory factor